MTMRTHPPPRNGVKGVIFLVCAAAAAAGLAVDFALGARPEFWLAAQPGAAAAFGVGAALFAALAARVALFVLAKGGRERRQ
jgi:hypothetical protein